MSVNAAQALSQLSSLLASQPFNQVSWSTLANTATAMPTTLGSLINQLVPVSAPSTAVAKLAPGVIEAVVLSSSPLLKNPSTNNSAPPQTSSPLISPSASNVRTTGATGQAVNPPQYQLTIKLGQQNYQLQTATAVAAESRIQLSIAPNQLATIIGVLDNRSGQWLSPQTGQTLAQPLSKTQPQLTGNRAALANQTPTASPVSTTATTDRSPIIAAPSLRQNTVEQAVRQALPQQQPLKALLPVILKLAEQSTPLPKTLARNISQYIQQTPSLQQLQSPPVLKQAVNNSGIFLEAKLAQASPTPTQAPDNPPQTSQRRAAPVVQNTPMPPASPAKTAATTAPSPSTDSTPPPRFSKPAAAAPPSALLNQDHKALLQKISAQLTQLITEKPASPQAPSSPSPAPVGDAPDFSAYSLPLLQKLAAQTNLATGDNQTAANNQQGNDVLLRQLGSQLLASLARSQLSQLESLTNRQANTADSTSPINSWSMDIPLLQGKQVDNLQLTIEQFAADENSGENDDEQGHHQWTVMLNFDLHSLGKFNVQLKVIQQTVSAVLWSEKESTHREVKQHLAELKNNLQKIGVTVKKIDCQLGLPPKTTQPLYKQLVDVRT